jgi:hypothetical protein
MRSESDSGMKMARQSLQEVSMKLRMFHSISYFPKPETTKAIFTTDREALLDKPTREWPDIGSDWNSRLSAVRSNSIKPHWVHSKV